MAWVVALAAAWVAVGAATAAVLIRRGHDVGTWVVVGLLFGVVAPVFGAMAVRAERSEQAVVVKQGAPDAPDDLDVVVGVDGSPESVAALRAVVDLHGPVLGRLTLATVVPFDADAVPEAEALLAEAARTVEDRSPATVVLRGDPADALGRFAVEDGDALVVVGARGRGRSAAPLGSVAARLAGGAPVPVLVGPAVDAARP